MIQFPATRRSLIATLRDVESSASTRTQAFDELARLYYEPVLTLVQYWGGNRNHDAEDLTQGVLLRLFESNDLKTLDLDGARFRSWLCVMVRHFVISARRQQHAQKRGGNFKMTSIDAANDERPIPAFVDTRGPDRAYARRQAIEILEQVMRDVEHIEREAGRLEHFDRMWSLMDGRMVPAELAVDLGISRNTLDQQVARLRKRHRGALYAYFLAKGVKPEDIRLEISRLFNALR